MKQICKTHPNKIAALLWAVMIALCLSSCSVGKPIMGETYTSMGGKFKFIKPNGDGTYAAYDLRTNTYIERIHFGRRMKLVSPTN